MPKTPTAQPPLVDAAARLDEELTRYEKLTEDVGRAPIGSEKALARAARLMEDAAACHERILQCVRTLSDAMVETRERQEASLARMADAARHVSERAEVFRSLVSRYATLGDMTKTLNASVAEIAAHKADGAPPVEVMGSIATLARGMGDAITEAETLARRAKEGAFEELARDADSLRQQIHSARNRLVLVQRTLAERAPS